MNQEEVTLELIRLYLEGLASEEETRRLEAEILRSPEVRRTFLRYARTDAALAGHRRAALGNLDRAPAFSSPIFRWMSRSSMWRPLAGAAAAGVILGMFCTSMVWAYVSPALAKPVVLMQENFESASAPLSAGIPRVAGIWGGDYSELVGEHQGVRPARGETMLRLVSPAYEGKTEQNSVRSDMYRVVDLRPFRHEIERGEAMVQISALFNSKSPVDTCRSDALITLYAFQGSHAFNQAHPMDSRLSQEAIAKVRKSISQLDANPDTWEKLLAEMRLPAEADFLVIHLGMKPTPSAKPADSFAGLYVDDVRLSLGRRTAIE
ncbi:MAG: hypothetical protein RLZZ399_1803 [Verrucomicrobiota bacterium]|jgi:hypothetical protein